MQTFNIPRIVIAGTHSGVGKTTMTLGIAALLKEKGLGVQVYKVGPDYIDAGYYEKITGRRCRNLDSWLIPPPRLLSLFKRNSEGADIAVVEGVMGLFDGYGSTESGSTAEVGKILKAPVILVVDARGLSRSSAAIVYGYQNFDLHLNLQGVLLNRIGSLRQLNLLQKVIEGSLGLSVLGYLGREEDLILPQRHLGLVPLAEQDEKEEFFQRLRQRMKEKVDIEKIIALARKAPFLSAPENQIKKNSNRDFKVRIGLALDEAFHFYYEDNLDLLKDYGAEIVPFSPLREKKLPSVDALYIGGGFPEVFASRLSANTSVLKDLREKIFGGLPTYAECGGLIYLSKGISENSKNYPLAGILPVQVEMQNSLQALGYVEAQALSDLILGTRGTLMRGHEFHWSKLKIQGKYQPAYKIKRSNGKEEHEGFAGKNFLASYVHLHFGSNPQLAQNFVKSALRGI